MKKLLLIFSLSLFGSSFSFGQTTIQEQYFHELKGMEDSSGTTHLFYREYNGGKYECSGNYGVSPTVRGNNIYHFNLDSKKDSVLFADYYSEWCLAGMIDSKNIFSYSFYNNNPKKWILSGSYGYTIGVSDYKGATLNYDVAIAIKASSQDYVPKEVTLSPNGDSLYVRTYSNITLLFSGNSNDWPKFEDNSQFIEYADSVAFGWEILGIHPQIDSLYFAVKSGDLYRSTHFSSDFTFADSSTYFRDLFFDADTSHIYALTSSGILRSDNLGEKDSWKHSEIDFKSESTKFLSVDQKATGHLFISDSTNILFSENYGDTFTSFISLDDEISGLYKKPDSNLLYALTRKELLEINTETKSVVSLKQLSVNNEPRPRDIPRQVTLNQNYPNPFNPTTEISYQLAKNSLVRLEVFDVTGRKVAVLVDGERKATGTHQVTFNAGNLASGVYFYRLETAGQTLTQKMLLVK